MATNEVFLKSMKMLVTEFEINMTKDRMEIWLEYLKEFDDDVLEKSAVEYVLTKNTKPYLSDIVAICKKHQKPHPKAMRVGDKWVIPNQ